MLRQHFELGERHGRDREEHIALQREIVARLEDLREPVTLQTARDLLRNMEHAQMVHITERDRVREFPRRKLLVAIANERRSHEPKVKSCHLDYLGLPHFRARSRD